MLNGAPAAYWLGFHALVLLAIVCDLALLHRPAAASGKGARKELQSHLIFFLCLMALAGAFGLWLAHVQGGQSGLEFASGYAIELSLSIDNLFVFMAMFRIFGLPPAQQKNALLYGVIGAILLRGILIFAGIALIRRFAWIQIVFGVLLAGVSLRLLWKRPGKLRQNDRGGLAAQGAAWLAGGSGRVSLLAAIAAIEAADLLFALDSIPAVLSVTNRTFVAYTSNIFAVLGLRSLYFLLATAMGRLRYLRFGLAAVLAGAGAKMILAQRVHIPIGVSLAFILGAMSIAALASLRHGDREGVS